MINYEAISSLLEYITYNFEEGAILVFLPGLAEITKMLEALAENPLFNDKVCVVFFTLEVFCGFALFSCA